MNNIQKFIEEKEKEFQLKFTQYIPFLVQEDIKHFLPQSHLDLINEVKKMIEKEKQYCHQDNFMFLSGCKDCEEKHYINIVLSDIITNLTSKK